MLLVIVKEKLEEGKVECFRENDEMFDFIHKFSMVFHSAQRTEIQFFQIQDFNVIVHYSPAKLRAFYALWILKLSELYKALKTRKNRKYSFIFSPGMFDITLVRQLFPNGKEKNRLMLVTLPDNSIYKIKWLPIILSHEAAHIGCERKRPSRHKAALKVCGRVISLEMHAFMLYGICTERELVESNLVVQAVQQNRKLLKELQDIITEKNEEIFKDMDSEERDDECRRDKSILHICEAFDYMYKYYHEKIIADYCCSMKYTCVEKSKIDRNISMGFNAIQNDLRYFLRMFIQDQLEKLLDVFYYIEEEAYADLITTLTLEYSMEDYIRFCAYVETTEEKSVTQGEAVIVRMALVVETACSIAEDAWVVDNNPSFTGKWNERRLQSLCQQFPKNSREKKLAAKIVYYMENVRVRDIMEGINSYKRQYNPENRCFDEENFDFLNDHEVWGFLCNYLKECAEEYIKKMKEENTIRKMQHEFAKTYEQLRSDSYMDVVQVIEDFLCKNANEDVLSEVTR